MNASVSTIKTVRSFLCVFFIFWLTACVPSAPQQPGSGSSPLADPATPTPEIFRPLDPSPTPSESDLPLTCQVTDLNVFVDRAAGFCFAYPMSFTAGEADGAAAYVFGPALEDGAQPLRASLTVAIRPLPAGSNLARLTDGFLASLGEAPWPIERTRYALGGEPAEMLAPVPGLGSARIVLLIHGLDLYTLTFHPVDAERAARDLEDLVQTVNGSFAFLDAPQGTAGSQTAVTWFEFGETFSLSYHPILAPWVIARTAAAVPPSDQIMYAEAHPANVEFVFYGFDGGRPAQLPLLPIENQNAQVKIFRTEDFPGFGDDHPAGFLGQLEALRTLLSGGIDPARCERPRLGEQDPLPYLPWINMAQTFCAQPQIIGFDGGQGIRYLTQFGQGPAPVLDSEVFYTFQGLTDDGRFYVAAFFPVTSGIFPLVAPPCPECSDANYDPIAAWTALLSDQLVRLNALSGDGFAPALDLLDRLVASIRIGE